MVSNRIIFSRSSNEQMFPFVFLHFICSSYVQQPIDIRDLLSSLAGRDVRVEKRILIRFDFPTHLFCIRCDPKRTLQQVIQPILDKLQLSANKFLFYPVKPLFSFARSKLSFASFLSKTDCLIPLNLNETCSVYDNQRLFAFYKTSNGTAGKCFSLSGTQGQVIVIIAVDMSTRDRFKIINDIFDMIPENDEDIHFDQYGILKTSKPSNQLNVRSTQFIVQHVSDSPSIFRRRMMIYCIVRVPHRITKVLNAD